MRVAPTTVVEIGDYIDGLQSYLRVRLANEEDALDITQEACLRVLRVNPASVENPRAYLYRIAHNLVYQHYRNRWQRLTNDVETDALASTDPSPEEIAATWIRKRQVETAMRELPMKCRMVLVLRWRDGLRVAEIAERMGLSRAMVKKYLAYGLAHFRKRLRWYVLADQVVG